MPTLFLNFVNYLALVMTGKEQPMGIVTFEDISEEIWGDLYDEDEDSRIRQVFADRVKGKMAPPV